MIEVTILFSIMALLSITEVYIYSYIYLDYICFIICTVLFFFYKTYELIMFNKKRSMWQIFFLNLQQKTLTSINICLLTLYKVGV